MSLLLSRLKNPKRPRPRLRAVPWIGPFPVRIAAHPLTMRRNNWVWAEAEIAIVEQVGEGYEGVEISVEAPWPGLVTEVLPIGTIVQPGGVVAWMRVSGEIAEETAQLAKPFRIPRARPNPAPAPEKPKQGNGTPPPAPFQLAGGTLKRTYSIRATVAKFAEDQASENEAEIGVIVTAALWVWGAVHPDQKRETINIIKQLKKGTPGQGVPLPHSKKGGRGALGREKTA